MAPLLENFHFLRPEWLWLLLTVPLIAMLLRRGISSSDDWERAIPSHLLKVLRPGKVLQTRSHGSWYAVLAVSLISLALAGPSWTQKPQPVTQINDELIVVLDLSVSMLATDQTPNRLTRAKQKLQDLLTQRREGTTALVVFSGDSHVVTPLTDDTNTILANLPALEPFMMPVIGSRPDKAIESALQLLKRGKANHGRILLITDGIEAHQAERIEESLSPTSVSLSILGIGTEAGGPIDLGERGYLKSEGSVVIPKTATDTLSQAARANRGRFIMMTLDDNDLAYLDVSGAQRIATLKSEQEQSLNREFDAWEDAGFWLLLAIIPLILISHRQGALFVLLLLIIPPEESLAQTSADQGIDINTSDQVEGAEGFRWMDLWMTRDQQAQQRLDQGDYASAAALFESPSHKAAAQYRSGDFSGAQGSYEESARSHGANGSSQAHYNRGNSLAQQQDFQGAIAAYDKALEENPNNDDALFNKQLIEDWLKSQAQQAQDQQGGDSSQSEDQQKGDTPPQGDSNEDDSNQDNSSQDRNGQNKNRENQSGDDQSSQNQNGQDNQGQQQDNQRPQEDSESAQQNANDRNGQNDEEQTSDQTQQSSAKQGQNGDNEQTGSASADNTEQTQASGEQQQALRELDELSEEERQSFEQWMRRVPDDPSGLLRSKFEQQSRERNREPQEPGEPLW